MKLKTLRLFVQIREEAEAKRYVVHDLFFDAMNRECSGFLVGSQPRKISWTYIPEFSRSSDSDLARGYLFLGEVCEVEVADGHELPETFLVMDRHERTDSQQFSVNIRWLASSCVLMPRLCHAIATSYIDTVMTSFSLPIFRKAVLDAAARISPQTGDVIGVRSPESEFEGAMLVQEQLGEDDYLVDLLLVPCEGFNLSESSKLWSEYETDTFGLTLHGQICVAEIVRIH